ncbi:MAG: hypothetical protein DRG78_02535 [Epsilonproteobacteria bacterium]|nr:MAG: hypothetical protein DRG78_02535 [Campylobacterota bacterium]
MENINLELLQLKEIYNYISESVIISDSEHNIVLINNAAMKKLNVKEEDVLYKKLTDFIPLESQEKILETIKNEDASYYEIFLKKKNNELFAAFVSGQQLPLKDDIYGILTIVDVSQLKNKENTQLKKLKSHIISQATTHAKKQNEVKSENTGELIFLQEELVSLQEERDQLKHEIFKMERKITLFERENQVLNGQCDKIQEDSFSFEQVLTRELALAKRYDRHFSLAIVAIDNYKSFSEQVNNEAKKDLILRAFKKHFKSTTRTTDVIYYENSGLFYLLLPNSNDVNITDLVGRLLHAKRIDTKIIVRFNCGIAHFYPQDTNEHIIYRARKNLETNIAENQFVKSK